MKKIFIYLFFCLMAIGARAQVDEVKLVVSGSGNTREDAIASALRSAVEQAFGVFVSSNTTILNDQLVKDEVATISSGNIKSYDLISDITTTNGKSNVTVSAVVSVNNLIQYAEAKGASCEFAGTLFGANLRLLELNKKNTKIAFQHMLDLLKSYSGRMVDYEISVSNPQIDGTITVEISLLANDNTKTIGEIIENTINSISVDWKEFQKLKNIGVEMSGGWLPVNYGNGGNWSGPRSQPYGLACRLFYPEDDRYIYTLDAVSKTKLIKTVAGGLLDFDIIAKDYQNMRTLIDLDQLYRQRKKFVLHIYEGVNKCTSCAACVTDEGVCGPPFYYGDWQYPLTFPFKCSKGTILAKNSFVVRISNLASIKSFEIVPGGYKK